MKAAIWDRLMDALASPSDDSVTMIDGTSVRVHHLAATLKTDHPDRCLGRSRGGLTTKIHALTNGEGLPIKVSITPGHAHDLTAANELLSDLAPGAMLLADKAYDADWLRAKLRARRSWANIPPKSTENDPSSSVRGFTKSEIPSSGSSASSNATDALPPDTTSWVLRFSQ